MYNRMTVNANGLLMYHVLRSGPVLVVGAGVIGSQRSALAMRTGATVRVVDPELRDDVEGHERFKRAFIPEDLNDVSLAFVATNYPEVNREVARLARQKHIPVNVADVPELCDFYLPALVQRGNLVIGISTKGGCPGYAAYVRRRLTPIVGESWGQALEIMASARRWCKGQSKGQVWRDISMDLLIDCCAHDDMDRVNELLSDALGAGVTLKTIGARWGE